MSELFQLFDSQRRQVGILDWGIKMTTLEDGEEVGEGKGEERGRAERMRGRGVGRERNRGEGME